MTFRLAACSNFVALLATPAPAAAASTTPTKSEIAGATSQDQKRLVLKHLVAPVAKTYGLDRHHASVIAELAHIDLSLYTLPFNIVSGTFDFSPSTESASDSKVTINADAVDTREGTFDKGIATNFFEYLTISFNTDAVEITNDHASVKGKLDRHGIQMTVVLKTANHGFTAPYRVFSSEAAFKRPDPGVNEWVPLEAEEVTILVETESVKQ